jgi:hypothetical protein
MATTNRISNSAYALGTDKSPGARDESRRCPALAGHWTLVTQLSTNFPQQKVLKMKLNRLTWLPLIAVATFSLAGCQDAAEPTGATGPVSELPPPTMDDHAEHAHPSEGPHHGDLVELGNEEYHAEVVHNEDAGTLEIYILDGAATKQVAIDATELTINVTHDGKPEQFILTAKPDQADEAGKSSRFLSDDKELAAHLDEEGTNPKLVVKINGKSYRGEIKHDHDHEGHDHAHDDHDKPAGK